MSYEEKKIKINHEHAAPLWVIESGLHHEKLHCLRWMTR